MNGSDDHATAGAELRGYIAQEAALAARGGRPLVLTSIRPTRAATGRLFPREALGVLRRSDQVVPLAAGGFQILMPDTDVSSGTRAARRVQQRLGPDWEAEVAELAPPGRRPQLPSGRPVPESPVGGEEARDGIRLEPAGVVALLSRPLPWWKRSMDVVLAAAGLLFLAPLLVGIAIAVKLSSRGPILFRQTRLGRDLVPFQILKFRTMRGGAESERMRIQDLNEMTGPLFKSAADPRVTRLGRLLRRTSLDELPQLVNVLRGEMSLLGPRALSPKASEYAPWQLRRFLVTPGVACCWQATRRGESSFDEWMRSDLSYVDARERFLSDARLLLRILWAVVTCAGGR